MNNNKEKVKICRDISLLREYQGQRHYQERVDYTTTKSFTYSIKFQVWKKYDQVLPWYVSFLAFETKSEELHKLLDMNLDKAGIEKVVAEIDKRSAPSDYVTRHEKSVEDRLVEVSRYSAPALKKVVHICEKGDIYFPELKETQVSLAKTETDNRRWTHIIGHVGTQTYDSFAAITGEICVSTVNNDQLYDHDGAIAILMEGEVREFYKGDCWSSRKDDGTRVAGNNMGSYFRPEGFLVPAKSRIIAVFGSEYNIGRFNIPESIQKHYTSLRVLDLRSYMSCDNNQNNIQKLRTLGIRFKTCVGWHAPGKKGMRLIFVAKREDLKATRLSGYSWDGYAENPITGDYYNWDGWRENIPQPYRM